MFKFYLALLTQCLASEYDQISLDDSNPCFSDGYNGCWSSSLSQSWGLSLLPLLQILSHVASLASPETCRKSFRENHGEVPLRRDRNLMENMRKSIGNHGTSPYKSWGNPGKLSITMEVYGLGKSSINGGSFQASHVWLLVGNPQTHWYRLRRQLSLL